MRQTACVIIIIAAFLWPIAANAQDTTGQPCAFATDAAELILDPEQVGVGFSEFLLPSPGHIEIEEMPDGWLGYLDRGFRNGPVRILQNVQTFDGPDSAAAYAAQQIQAQHAVVR